MNDNTNVSRLVLTINGGLSSIKFALFETGKALRRVRDGKIERIGLPDASFQVTDAAPRKIPARNHTAAVNALMDWLEGHVGRDALAAVGHRVVHGGHKYSARSGSRARWLNICTPSVRSTQNICRKRLS